MAEQRLTRDLQHSMRGGAGAGGANRYGFDVPLARIVTVLLALLLLTACGNSKGVVAELGRVSNVKAGTPILAFIYTDG